jgi:hypothetical protein
MIDILLKNNDINIVNGDIEIGEARQQDIELICKSEKGQFYQYPKLGVGIERQLNGSKSITEIKGEIRDNLLQDNFIVKYIKIKDNNIYIDAE